MFQKEKVVFREGKMVIEMMNKETDPQEIKPWSFESVNVSDKEYWGYLNVKFER